MKRKILFTFFLMNLLFCGSLLSQTSITLSFGATLDGQSHPPDSVRVQNLTRGWVTVLEYPDSLLELEETISVSETEGSMHRDLVLSPLFPNPSADRTTAQVFIPEAGMVRLSVFDLTGREQITFDQVVSAGYHTFQIVPGMAGHYLVVAETSRHRQSQKLISQGIGNVFSIEYAGFFARHSGVRLGKTGFPWEPGDQLRFTGFVTLAGSATQEDTLTDAPVTSTHYTFKFTEPSASYRPGTVHCEPANPTLVIEVVNPVTGKVWMDRNLGASKVASGATDVDAYGDLYQWGRFADGHQCRNSPISSTTSQTDQPGHGEYIAGAWNWRSPANDTLWMGETGTNNPCPVGFRLPTEAEMTEERLSWSNNNTTGAFSSPLKFTNGGWRGIGGLGSDWGSSGRYWTMTVDGSGSKALYFSSTDANTMTEARAIGSSVRCIKN